MTKQNSFAPPPHQMEALRRGELKLIVVRCKPQPILQYRAELYRAVVDKFGCCRWYYDDIVDGPNRIAEGACGITNDERPINFIACPLGLVGDEIVCKERYKIIAGHFLERTAVVRYEDDETREFRNLAECWPIRLSTKFRPARTMPQWASRYSLRLLSVEVRRVNTITEDEAVDCGCEGWWEPMHPDMGSTDGRTPAEQFQERYIEQYGASFDSDFAWFARVEVKR